MPGNFFGEALICGEDGPGQDDAGLTDIAFLSRMAGSLYICGCIDTWPQDARRRGRYWVEVHKRIRHLLVRDFYRLLPQPQSNEDWDAAQYCDGSTEGIVFAFRYGGSDDSRGLRLHCLDADASYVVKDEATGEQQTIAGQTLQTDGLAVELAPVTAKLFSYHR